MFNVELLEGTSQRSCHLTSLHQLLPPNSAARNAPARLESALHVALLGLQCLEIGPSPTLLETSRQISREREPWMRSCWPIEKSGRWLIKDFWFCLAEGCKVYPIYWKLSSSIIEYAHIVFRFTKWCFVSFALNQAITSSAWCYAPALRLAIYIYIYMSQNMNSYIDTKL